MITLEEINAQIGRSVIINVNKTYNNISLYEATKKCWRMNIDRAFLLGMKTHKAKLPTD